MSDFDRFERLSRLCLQHNSQPRPTVERAFHLITGFSPTAVIDKAQFRKLLPQLLG